MCYQKKTLSNYSSLMKTLLLFHCTHHTFIVLWSKIFGMVSNDVAISPESLSIPLLTKTDKNLSSLPLLPSIANQYQLLNNNFYFRLLVICFATVLVSICGVFVRPNWYLFTILEFGNMFQNSLAVWSGVLKGKFVQPEN